MKWDDLEVGDKLRFNQEYIDCILKHVYEYIGPELTTLRKYRDKQLEIIALTYKTLSSGNKTLYITLKGFNILYRIDSITGLDVGYGRRCPLTVFVIDELKGE